MESKTCPNCGQKTIKEASQQHPVLMTNPPIYTVRQWCGCGYRGEWESERALTHDEILNQEWERANKPVDQSTDTDRQ